MIFPDATKRESVYDTAGNVMPYSDESGSVVLHSYDPLGRKTATSISLASGVGQLGSSAILVSFRSCWIQNWSCSEAFVGKQGHYQDGALDLYMLGASNGQGGRYYNPATARLIARLWGVDRSTVNAYVRRLNAK